MNMYEYAIRNQINVNHLDRDADAMEKKEKREDTSRNERLRFQRLAFL